MTRPARRGNFVEKVRQIEEGLAGENLSSTAEYRLQAVIKADGSTAGRRGNERAYRNLGWALACTAAAMAALFFIRIPSRDNAPTPTAPRSIAGLTITEGEFRQEGDRIRCLSTVCKLQGEAVELTLNQLSLMGRRQEHFEAVEGQFIFQVQRRPSPLRVYVFSSGVSSGVSTGIIEVLGTRFRIWQRKDRGRVSLDAGRIRYTEGGIKHELSPGQSLAWPLNVTRSASRPSTEAERPVSKRGSKLPAKGLPRPPVRPQPKALSAQDTESLLQRVERLRSQARFSSAINLIRKNLPLISNPVDAERFSYELGALLADHGPDPQKACAHFAKHLRRFGSGRYGAEIEGIRKRKRCGMNN